MKTRQVIEKKKVRQLFDLNVRTSVLWGPAEKQTKKIEPFFDKRAAVSLPSKFSIKKRETKCVRNHGKKMIFSNIKSL